MSVRLAKNTFIKFATLYPDEMQEAGGITTKVLVLLMNHARATARLSYLQPVTIYIGAVNWLTFGPQERLDDGEEAENWLVRLYSRDCENITLVCRNGDLVLESYEGNGGSLQEAAEDHARYSRQMGELLSTKADLLFPAKMET
jgi:hypothetical protein